MRTLLILLNKELRSFFFSPIAYIVIGLIMVLNGISFNASVAILQEGPASSASLVTWGFQSPWFYISYFAVFPIITMRLFAEEQRSGTIESLLTAPVRTSQLVLAKYMAAVVFYCLLWLPSIANFYIFQWVTVSAAEIPTGELVGGYLILFFMGLFNLSMGCFASALTKNQLIAAILGLTLCLLHFLVGFFALYTAKQIPENLQEIVSYFASVDHLRTFSTGLLDTRPVVYYLSISALFLMFTHQVLEYRRWKV